MSPRYRKAPCRVPETVTAGWSGLALWGPGNGEKVAVSQGLMNLLAPFFSGVPMCHGVGGMAGHIRFGAQTGGALGIMGGILLILALFFSTSVDVVFQVFPMAVVGVVLFFAGLEVASAATTVSREKPDFYVMLVPPALGCGTWVPVFWPGWSCNSC